MMDLLWSSASPMLSQKMPHREGKQNQQRNPHKPPIYARWPMCGHLPLQWCAAIPPHPPRASKMARQRSPSFKVPLAARNKPRQRSCILTTWGTRAGTAQPTDARESRGGCLSHPEPRRRCEAQHGRGAHPPSCPPTSYTNRRHAEGLRSLEDDATDRSDSGLGREFSSSSDGKSDSIRRFNSKMGSIRWSPARMCPPSAMDTLWPSARHHSTFVSPV